jgi:plasmid maintenance system killer protein
VKKYSVFAVLAVNMQARICFEWEAGHAYKVEIVDYH